MSNITIKDLKLNKTLTLTLECALEELSQAMQKKQALRALSYAQQITQQAPNCLPAYTQLYQILSFLQKFSELEQAALTAIKHNPEHSQSYHALANAYRFQRKTKQALLAMEKAVGLAPQNIAWLNALGIMNKELGRFDVALRCFEQCIGLSPDFTQAYWHRSDIKAHMPSKYIEHLIKLVNSNSDITINAQVYAAYALFKHFETMDDFEKAFYYLQLGATKQRSSFNYDHQAELTEHKSIEEVFNKDFFNKNKTAITATSKTATSRGIPDDSPIFICGLPRSGTTLTEQIISSHTDVAAGDELFELAQATQNVLQQVKPRQPFPFLANELTNEHWKYIGKEYLTLTQHINTKKHFTDKMPLNYKAIGLITMALPSAKIVYCQRSPMDLLLGAYKQILDQGNKYTYDLDELTSMIIAHHHLMQHWLKMLPNNIFTLNYQTLIVNQKETTAKLLQFLGLPWQDACLNFHENNRVIHTLSNTQVRKPLFKSSINAWHKYSEQLEPYANKMQKAGLVI